MIYAVDFDGTLCKDKYPEIGEPRPGVIDFIKSERERGAKLILWTCRCGEHLAAAVDWCKAQGLTFDAVNENLPEHKGRLRFRTDGKAGDAAPFPSMVAIFRGPKEELH